MNINISKFLFFLVLISVIISCSNKKDTIFLFSNPNIEYWGRIDATQNNATALYWSGSSIKINFEGTSIQAELKDETGDNYYNVIIDNDSLHAIKPDTIKKYYSLATNLSKGKHTLELFKRTEWNRGKTLFYGIKTDKILQKDAPKKRKIEFYGNSITAGYAVEDLSGKDSPDSTYTNNYLSYAAITARHCSN